MQVTALPISEDAKSIFIGLMDSDNRVDLEMAKDGEVFIVSHNRKFNTWTPLNGSDWEVILPSMAKLEKA
jgi:hypothetical protein